MFSVEGATRGTHNVDAARLEASNGRLLEFGDYLPTRARDVHDGRLDVWLKARERQHALTTRRATTIPLVPGAVISPSSPNNCRSTVAATSVGLLSVRRRRSTDGR